MRGTVAVLLADFLAAMAVITFGLLYARTSPFDLLILTSITIGFFLVVLVLLSKSETTKGEMAHSQGLDNAGGGI